MMSQDLEIVDWVNDDAIKENRKPEDGSGPLGGR